MNPDQNNNEPKIIEPQWQYTSGSLSQQQQFTSSPGQEQQANPQELNEVTSQSHPSQAIQTQPNPIINNTQGTQPVPGAKNIQTEQFSSVTTTAQPEEDNYPQQALISWRASEFALSDKNGSWYMFLAIGSIVFAILTYLLTKQIFSVVVILILGITVAFYGRIKPRVLDYSIDNNGIFVGSKYYLFSQFKSFSIIEDQAIPSIHLTPVKKLMMPITIYIAPAEADKIIDILGNILPFENRKRDIADKLSQKLRF